MDEIRPISRLAQFHPTQINLAIDLKGALLCDKKNLTCALIMADFASCIKQIFQEELWFEFFNPFQVNLPQFKDGCNFLDTYFQQEALDQYKIKALNIKFYDKLTELVGRGGSNLVGSRIKEIVGSKGFFDRLTQRFRNTITSGVTRLEVSFFFNH